MRNTVSTITVNGNVVQTTQHTLQLVLEELGLNQGRYAVEMNSALVPKSELATTPVVDAMIVEVVQAVGGG